MIQIKVNGSERTVEEGTTLDELVRGLGYGCGQAVVEYNGKVVHNDLQRPLENGDVIVVVPMIAGGQDGSVLDLIGNTPLVRLQATGAFVYGKLEMRNPGGSVKDRIALSMVEHAEKEGKLSPGGTMIEPTSGNTGIGLAIVAAVKGYRLMLVMPESMSVERRAILSHLGAEVVLTPAADGMAGAVRECERMCSEYPGAFCPDQFSNPANPLVHERTTAVEIWEQTGGRVDTIVSGVGTGGTITGVARELRRRNPQLKVFGVEPAGSPVLSGGSPGRHLIQGIGAGFVPDVLDRSLVDEIMTVSDDDAITTARQLASKEGIMVGISSGAAVYAAREVARGMGSDQRVVVILPDGGERYLSVLRTMCNC